MVALIPKFSDSLRMQPEQVPPVEIPLNILSASALSGVILNFIEREGTDYGAVEVSLLTKIEQIKKQLNSGDIKIIFDPNTESVTLMTARDWQKNSTQLANLISF